MALPKLPNPPSPDESGSDKEDTAGKSPSKRPKLPSVGNAPPKSTMPSMPLPNPAGGTSERGEAESESSENPNAGIRRRSSPAMPKMDTSSPQQDDDEDSIKTPSDSSISDDTDDTESDDEDTTDFQSFLDAIEEDDDEETANADNSDTETDGDDSDSSGSINMTALQDFMNSFEDDDEESDDEEDSTKRPSSDDADTEDNDTDEDDSTDFQSFLDALDEEDDDEDTASASETDTDDEEDFDNADSFQDFMNAIEDDNDSDDEDSAKGNRNRSSDADEDDWGIEPISDDEDVEDGFSEINDVTEDAEEDDGPDLDLINQFLRENEDDNDTETDGDSDTPLQEEEEAEKEEVGKSASKKKEKDDKGKGAFSKIKDYWNGFAEKAKQDGSSEPRDDEDEEEPEPERLEDTQDEDDEKEPKQGFFKSIGAVYSKIHGAVFGALLKLLNLLAKLPFIGKYFRKALNATRILEKVSHFLPIIIILLIWFLLNAFYVATEYSLELPDQGEVEVSNATYDSGTNTVTAEVENIGGVMVEISTDYTVYSTQLELNPITWFIPQETTTCTADWTVIEQTDITTVEADCEDTETGGFWYRVAPERVIR